MQTTDNYTNALTDVLHSLEQIYGITELVSSSDTGIVSIVTAIDSNLRNLPAAEQAQQNVEAGKQVVLLSYLFFRLKYFKSDRLDFSTIPAMGQILKILEMFTEKKNFNRCVGQVNQIIKALDKVDKESSKARYGLGYCYLRIFIVMVMYRNACNASIVANLLIQQITNKLGEGL